MEVETAPEPNVSIDPLDPFCDYVPAFQLTIGNPAGGTYSGNGVTGSVFDPSLVGIGPTTVTYTYTDANDCVGTAQETITVNNCAGISEAEAGVFMVYPNPSQGNFTIASELFHIEAVTVYDAAGKLVAALKFAPTLEVELDLLPFANGVYHAEILSGSHTQRVQLVINK